jgi:ATP/maltotriose-dependent transcriptional regulator MalT
MEQICRDSYVQDPPPFLGSRASVVHREKFLPHIAPADLVGGRTNFNSARWRECSTEVTLLDCPGRPTAQESPAGVALPKIKRNLAEIWRLMLALRIDEALRGVDELELRLHEVSPANARQLRAATQLLRAAGFAFQDDSLAVIPLAVSLLKRGGPAHENHTALALCRLGFWRLGEFDCFSRLPRPEPRARWSKLAGISVMLDLSIEAAVALDQLRMSTAKRLALDALTIAKFAPKEAAGLATLPACVAAQVLYEEGCLDQADTLLRDQLPAINAWGPIECALRGYLVLSRVARQRKQFNLAALLLREAEALGERRGWPRLVAACLAERASLLLRDGQVREARFVLEYLDRYAKSHHSGSGHATAEITRYRTLTRWRVSWAETRSREAVAGLRQLCHDARDKWDLYVGSEMSVELAGMLMAIEETEEADALLLGTVKTASAAGMFQIFLEGGTEIGLLLRRAYAQAAASNDADVLSFVGSLLSRWDSRDSNSRSARRSSRVSDTLTGRERDVLAMIRQGFANKRIARFLEISPETVKSHVKRIFLKLAVSTRTEAVSRAGSLGLM